MSQTPQATLGKYQIIREIARSNDIVYEAYDPLMNRRVALKELSIPSSSTSAQRDDRVKRFEREVKAAGSLAHPNIVTIYEVGNDGDRFFMAMEYLDGHTLRNELDTKGFLPIDRAFEISLSILEALDFAHSKGVIHRDIKPDNIQLLSSGLVKLTDFGIARLTFEPNLTMDGQVFGTPSYMSPEQVVGKDIDVRSDVFSVGVLLYEMISGTKPFPGDSIVAITHAITTLPPSPSPQMSHALWEVISMALEKVPSQRFASAKAMATALENYRTGTLSGVIPGSVVGGPPPIVSYGAPIAPQPPQQYPTPYSGQPTGYGMANYGQPAPVQYQGGPPSVPIPIYYPPPPRQPLLKAETKQFLVKLFLTLVIVSTVFLLLMVSLSAISGTIQRIEGQSRNQSEGSHGGPLANQIRQAEWRATKASDPVSREQARFDAAALYEQQGKTEMGAGRFEEAEQSFAQAVSLDPTNAALYTNLGALFAKVAESQTPDLAAQSWQRSGEYWARAAELETNSSKSRTYLDAAATCHLNRGDLLADLSRPTIARESYEKAESYALPGSDLQKEISSRLGPYR